MKHPRRKQVLTICIVLGLFGLGMSVSAQSQTADAFSTEADAIKGSVTHNPILGLLPQTVTINPVDDSTSNTNGTSDQKLASASQTALGISIYTLSNANDSTTDCDTGSCDEGDADASMSSFSLLGGLVTGSNVNAPLKVVPDPTQTNTADFSGHTTFHIGGSGVLVPTGTYTPGTHFAVSGLITVPLLNALGLSIGSQQVTFTGTLTLDDLIAVTDPTSGSKVGQDVVAAHLQGSAPDGLGGSYAFDLQVGGPKGCSERGGNGGCGGAMRGGVGISILDVNLFPAQTP